MKRQPHSKSSGAAAQRTSPTAYEQIMLALLDRMGNAGNVDLGSASASILGGGVRGDEGAYTTPQMPLTSRANRSRTSPREARVVSSNNGGVKSKLSPRTKLAHASVPVSRSPSAATTDPLTSYGSLLSSISASPSFNQPVFPVSGAAAPLAIESALSNLPSLCVATGSIDSGDKLINYTIREYPGTCFGLQVYVPTTQQSWSLFLPVIDTVLALRRLWLEQESMVSYDRETEQRHNEKLGKWLLGCTTLEFDGGLISNAHFDHDGFKNKYNSEVVGSFKAAAQKLGFQGGGLGGIAGSIMSGVSVRGGSFSDGSGSGSGKARGAGRGRGRGSGSDSDGYGSDSSRQRNYADAGSKVKRRGKKKSRSPSPNAKASKATQKPQVPARAPFGGPGPKPKPANNAKASDIYAADQEGKARRKKKKPLKAKTDTNSNFIGQQQRFSNDQSQQQQQQYLKQFQIQKNQSQQLMWPDVSQQPYSRSPSAPSANNAGVSIGHPSANSAHLHGQGAGLTLLLSPEALSQSAPALPSVPYANSASNPPSLASPGFDSNQGDRQHNVNTSSDSQASLGLTSPNLSVPELGANSYHARSLSGLGSGTESMLGLGLGLGGAGEGDSATKAAKASGDGTFEPTFLSDYDFQLVSESAEKASERAAVRAAAASSSRTVAPETTMSAEGVQDSDTERAVERHRKTKRRDKDKGRGQESPRDVVVEAGADLASKENEHLNSQSKPDASTTVSPTFLTSMSRDGDGDRLRLDFGTMGTSTTNVSTVAGFESRGLSTSPSLNANVSPSNNLSVNASIATEDDSATASELQSEISGILMQMKSLKQAVSNQKISIDGARFTVNTSPEEIDRMVARAESERKTKTAAQVADLQRALSDEQNRNASNNNNNKDPYAAMAAAAAAAAVAASEAILSTRVDRNGRDQHLREEASVKRKVEASAVLDQARELTIQALRDELRVMQEQADEQLREAVETKEREMAVLRQQREIELQRVSWEKEQILLEKEQEVQALQLVQQLELQAVNRASEREIKGLANHLEGNTKVLEELQRQRQLEIERVEQERLAREEEVALIAAARDRDLERARLENEEVMQRAREVAERALMSSEHDLSIAFLQKEFEAVQQQIVMKDLLSQVRPLQKENELLLEMLDVLVAAKADEAIDALETPLFAHLLWQLALQADFLEGENEYERETRKQVEAFQRKADEEKKARELAYQKEKERRDAEITAMLSLRENDIEALKHLLEDQKSVLRRTEEDAMVKEMQAQKDREAKVATGELQLVQARLQTVIELEADLNQSSFGKAAVRRLRDERARLEAMQKVLLEGGALGDELNYSPSPSVAPRTFSGRFGTGTNTGSSTSVRSPSQMSFNGNTDTNTASEDGDSVQVTGKFGTATSTLGSDSPLSTVENTITSSSDAANQAQVADTASGKMRWNVLKMGLNAIRRSSSSGREDSVSSKKTVSISRKISFLGDAEASGGSPVSAAVAGGVASTPPAVVANQASTSKKYGMSPMLADTLSESARVLDGLDGGRNDGNGSSVEESAARDVSSSGRPAAKQGAPTTQERIARLRLAVSHYANTDEAASRDSGVKVTALLRTIDTSTDVRLITMACETALQANSIELATRIISRINTLITERDKAGEPILEIDFSWLFKLLILCCEENSLLHQSLDAVFLVCNRKQADDTEQHRYFDRLSVCGVFEMLAVAVNYHIRDPVMCFKALKIFFRLTQTHLSNRARLARDPIYTDLLKTMSKNHKNNPSVLDPLLRVLVNMTTDCTEGVEVLIQEDTAAALVRLLKIHVKNDRMVAVVCRVLINIASTHSKRVQFHISAASSTFVVALDLYRSRLKVLDVICWALLAGTAENDDVKHVLLDAGIVNVLAEIQQNDATPESVVLFVMKVLVSLVTPSYEKSKQVNMQILKFWTSCALRRGHSEIKTKASIAIEKVFGQEGLQAKNQEEEFVEAQRVLLNSQMQQEAAQVLKNIADAKARAAEAKAAAEAAIQEEMQRQQQEQLWRLKEEAEEALKIAADKERMAREVAEEKLREFQEQTQRERERMAVALKSIDDDRAQIAQEKDKVLLDAARREEEAVLKRKLDEARTTQAEREKAERKREEGDRKRRLLKLASVEEAGGQDASLQELRRMQALSGANSNSAASASTSAPGAGAEPGLSPQELAVLGGRDRPLNTNSVPLPVGAGFGLAPALATEAAAVIGDGSGSAGPSAAQLQLLSNLKSKRLSVRR